MKTSSRKLALWGIAAGTVILTGTYLALTRAQPSLPAFGEAMDSRKEAVPPSATSSIPVLAPVPGTTTGNVIAGVSFTGGDAIVFQQEGRLKLRSSRGWLWGRIQAVDLAAFPIMAIEFNSPGQGSVWLELKNAADEGLIGGLRYGVRKKEWEVPNTRGHVQRLELDLRKDLVNSSSTAACILAFSDPETDVEIISIAFRKADRQRQ